MQDNGFNKVLIKHRAETVMKYASGDSCLEAGCGEGHITKYLVNKFKFIDAIDNDQKVLKKIKSNEKLCKMCIPIEKFLSPYMSYGTIVCTQVLEHVDDPKAVIKVLKKHAHEETVFIFTVPNAKSVNRMVGVDLGLIPYPEYLDTQDLAVGHQRMFTLKTFKKLMHKHFDIVECGTMIYKPLPNAMMQKLPKSIVKKMINMEVNEMGAEIYAVCMLK